MFRGTSSGSYISGVNVENCQFENTIGIANQGISCAAIFFQYVENSEIKNCDINVVKNTSAQTDGIFIQAGHNIDILDNEVFLQNNYSAPEGSQPHVDCIQVTYFSNGAHSQNINIERNKLTNNSTIAYNNTAIYADRQGLDANDVEDTLRIINNTIVSAQGWNLINVHFNDSTHKANILNNTLIGENNNPHLLSVYRDGGEVAALSIKNNIFYKANVSGEYQTVKFENLPEDSLSNLILNYNLHYTGTGTPEINFQGTAANWNSNSTKYENNGVTGDPNFADYSNGDFSLDYTSPAKNKGIYLSEITEDNSGNPRPYWGNDYDIGAYEIEDTQFKIGGYDPDPNATADITFTLTSYGTYWERNSNGTFSISSTQWFSFRIKRRQLVILMKLIFMNCPEWNITGWIEAKTVPENYSCRIL